jgi:hypothetical protein
MWYKLKMLSYHLSGINLSHSVVVNQICLDFSSNGRAQRIKFCAKNSKRTQQLYKS